MLSGKNRIDIKIGCDVEIVEKANQKSGTLTVGFVERILTKSKHHPLDI